MGDHHHHHHHHLTQESSQSMEDQPLNFSALRLESSPTITTTPHHHHHPCSNCGFFGSGSGSGCITDHSNSASHKRPLPPPSTPTSLLCPTDLNDPQPKPKKLFLEQNDVASPSPPPSAAADDSTPTNPFLLRRCVSDPYHAPPSTDSFRGSGSGIFSNTYSSPQNNVIKTNTNSVTPCSAPLPPRPPPLLRRCVSDPTSSPFKNYSRNSSSNDLDKTPKPKKLGKMWDCWKEMNSKMEELMSEELLEEENDNNNNNAVVAGYEKNDNVLMKNDVVSNEDDVVVEESLSVERKGESLTVRFNCQCGRAYEFLLPGGNCYYKLL
ncbi:transcription factor MYB120 [Cannabis sativa]|uniref:transcription factor MYB120 n=1 Tax=Cannabis sativa TaxID=3483 RepID=UPI0029CA33A7|nr:transcription factor MYB120 [Cannabis sativa]